MKVMRILGIWSATVAAGFMAANAADVAVTLSGDQELPAVTTVAVGTGTIAVKLDKSVSGTITVSGFEAAMAHIHVAAAGKNGPPIIALKKTADNIFSVPDGAKLTDVQSQSFLAGELYVNVYSSSHTAGEIRGQLKPKG